MDEDELRWKRERGGRGKGRRWSGGRERESTRGRRR